LVTGYFRSLAEHFSALKLKDIDNETLHQFKRCLLDYSGCAVFAAAHRLQPALIDLALSMGPGSGTASIWGEELSLSPALAAFVNAGRTSHIELDDGSSMGAAVHPGVYVFSSALAIAEAAGSKTETVILGVLFGYDVCFRMGLLAAERERELGLHGPGLVGGLGAAAAGGLTAGLSVNELCSAFGITGSLLPLCPFISFIEGTDSKDFYGAWPAYLGITALTAAQRGLSGPEHILDGEKSLKSIFAAEKGTEYLLGKPYFITKTGFKEFSACASVHPAISALLAIMEENPFKACDIDRIIVSTYPYSYDLNAGVREPLNPSSARLSLPWTLAAAVIDGGLMPNVFFPKRLIDPAITALSRLVQVEKKTSYGEGAFGIRGSVVEIHLKNGSLLKKETQSTRWSGSPSDELLLEKFNTLTSSGLEEKDRKALADYIFDFENKEVKDYCKLMKKIQPFKETAKNNET
jgi:2-methylcitrate dehydratase PrpD